MKINFKGKKRVPGWVVSAFSESLHDYILDFRVQLYYSHSSDPLHPLFSITQCLKKTAHILQKPPLTSTGSGYFILLLP